MLPLRNVLVRAVAFTFALTACGGAVSPQPDAISVHKSEVGEVKFANVIAAGDLAFERAKKLQAYAFVVAAAAERVQPDPPSDPVPTVNLALPVTVAAATSPPIAQPTSGGPWVCISEAETGGVPAQGPVYFTEFGLVKDIIEDYGTPEEQAAVFGGYASFGQQLDIAVRFAAENGFGGWGSLTKSKCGLS